MVYEVEWTILVNWGVAEIHSNLIISLFLKMLQEKLKFPDAHGDAWWDDVFLSTQIRIEGANVVAR